MHLDPLRHLPEEGADVEGEALQLPRPGVVLGQDALDVGPQRLRHLGEEAFPGVGRGLDHGVPGVVVHHEARQEVPLRVDQAVAALGVLAEDGFPSGQGLGQVLQKGRHGVLRGGEAVGPHREVGVGVVEGEGEEAPPPVDGVEPRGFPAPKPRPGERPRGGGKGAAPRPWR